MGLGHLALLSCSNSVYRCWKLMLSLQDIHGAIAYNLVKYYNFLLKWGCGEYWVCIGGDI